ncbi:MAG: hypothetical protein HYX87_06760 [Chloroflexi bacterium]|nr:hypothetical protein [Chloroflexota bacterium]
MLSTAFATGSPPAQQSQVASQAYVLFVCAGNTCRSPMAKVILEQLLRSRRGLARLVTVDSAAYDHPTATRASSGARRAIEGIFGADLLA